MQARLVHSMLGNSPNYANLDKEFVLTLMTRQLCHEETTDFLKIPESASEKARNPLSELLILSHVLSCS